MTDKTIDKEGRKQQKLHRKRGRGGEGRKSGYMYSCLSRIVSGRLFASGCGSLSSLDHPHANFHVCTVTTYSKVSLVATVLCSV